ncbi:CRP/FNR family transcriptional regulator [Methylohalomonas lacus]|uniref:CRP/FNR family transcriptional regulator n=1 Tax=Methylohalomonas lacus TaxID=398773 RepID=A0AAE3HI68_9GAMM|nr:helix-turn-helix domain-containing protein [Methylohalomonas lacus]MCS3902811.1 CRP/FNR family transcriptional regulator [Methylohalomonas lacus]
MSYQRMASDSPVARASCTQCHLPELCLPRSLPCGELLELADIALVSSPIQRGGIIFKSNSPFRAIYAIRSGMVKQYYECSDGQQKILGFYLPGEMLGFDGIAKGRHQYSAATLETTTICELNYEELKWVCSRTERLDERFHCLMSQEISKENESLLLLKSKTAEQRLAIFLNSLSCRYKQLGYSANEFKLSMSRAEIGSYLGLTIETVSRLFSRMQREGLIESHHHTLRILDPTHLHALCSEQC